jgi:hypothetical protein
VLQAWHYLRAAGVQPDGDVASVVLGAAAEVAVEDKHDLLVAYRDGGVRYLNWGGKLAVVEPGNIPAVDDAVSAWLAVADVVARAVGVWDQDALPRLPAGHSRILMLSPGGKRFGQGPDDLLRADPPAAGFLTAATRLLLAVTAASTGAT